MANEYIRKEWAGAAVRTTVSGTLTAGATTINVADASSFPVGTFPFVLVLDRGTSTEEKVLCSTRGATSFTVLQRGYDGSVAAVHANGCTVEHALDAYTVDQANALASVMTAVGDIAYKSVAGDNASFARLAIGAANTVLRVIGGVPSWGTLNTAGITDGAVTLAKLAADSVDSSKIVNGSIATADLADGAITSAKILDGTIVDGDVASAAAIAYGKLALAGSIKNADLSATAGEPGGAWLTYTPTLSGATLGNGTISGRYIQIGKLVFFNVNWTLGSTSTVTGAPTITLPVTKSSAAGSGSASLRTTAFDASATAAYDQFPSSSATTVASYPLSAAGANPVWNLLANGTTPFTWAVNDQCEWAGFYEAA